MDDMSEIMITEYRKTAFPVISYIYIFFLFSSRLDYSSAGKEGNNQQAIHVYDARHSPSIIVMSTD